MSTVWEEKKSWWLWTGSQACLVRKGERSWGEQSARGRELIMLGPLGNEVATEICSRAGRHGYTTVESATDAMSEKQQIGRRDSSKKEQKETRNSDEVGKKCIAKMSIES